MPIQDPNAYEAGPVCRHGYEMGTRAGVWYLRNASGRLLMRSRDERRVARELALRGGLLATLLKFTVASVRIEADGSTSEVLHRPRPEMFDELGPEYEGGGF